MSPRMTGQGLLSVLGIANPGRKGSEYGKTNVINGLNRLSYGRRLKGKNILIALLKLQLQISAT